MSPSSTTNTLIFGPNAVIRYGGSQFSNVPVILQADGIPLIETIRHNDIGQTTQFSVFNADGTLLAQVVGSCLRPSEEGARAGLMLSFPSRLTVCSLGDRVLFEVRRVRAAVLAITAELFSPSGLLVKANAAGMLATVARDGQVLAEVAPQNRRIRNAAVGFAVSEHGKTVTLGP